MSKHLQIPWRLVKETPELLYYTSDFTCLDGDPVKLYIEKSTYLSAGGFELCCFSGIPASAIKIDAVDFPVLWEKAGIKASMANFSYTDVCIGISSYLCDIFCQKEKT